MKGFGDENGRVRLECCLVLAPSVLQLYHWTDGLDEMRKLCGNYSAHVGAMLNQYKNWRVQLANSVSEEKER